jgi:hypothetical protein
MTASKNYRQSAKLSDPRGRRSFGVHLDAQVFPGAAGDSKEGLAKNRDTVVSLGRQ